MTRIWLIRHAQASFGTDDYDRLSDLGHAQARWLGEWLAAHGVRPARIVTGAQVRHRETAEGIAAGLAEGGAGDPPPFEPHAGFNEYDADALFESWLRTEPAPAPGDRRAHFKALSGAISRWQAGTLEGAETWAEFEARTGAALDFATEGEGPVLAVTSGGVIGQTARRLIGAGPESMIRLHMQVKNAGFSRLVGAPGRLWLNSFNETPHFETRGEALTYS